MSSSDKMNYEFVANKPIKRKDTLKFVQFTVHANLVTKKLGTKYNSVTQRKLFHYNIVPKENTNLIVKHGDHSHSFSSKRPKIDRDGDTTMDESDTESTSSRYRFNLSKQRVDLMKWQADLLKDMSPEDQKDFLDQELEEYMQQGREEASLEASIKYEPDDE